MRIRKVIKMKVFRCEKCGKTLLTLVDSGCIPHCCGQEMTVLAANTTDGALEKHVPFVQQAGSSFAVQVGEVEHPMMEQHYIQWVALETNQGVHVKNLKPGEKPAAHFLLPEGEKALAAYEYCNLHGFWKKEL